MDDPTAREVLGLGASAGPSEVRAAFRRLVLSSHPDQNTSPDATERTLRLTAAYRMLMGATVSGPRRAAAEPPLPDEAQADRPVPDDSPQGDTAAAGTAAADSVRLLDDDTIVVVAPGPEVLAMLVESGHRLGEIAYLDRGAGLIEVVVEFTDAPTSSVVMTLQGRGDGTTEIFCTVEPLSGGNAPPADAVTRLVARTLRGEDPSA